MPGKRDLTLVNAESETSYAVMEEGDWRLRLIRGDIMACAILPVPRKEILEKISEGLGVVEKDFWMVE